MKVGGSGSGRFTVVAIAVTLLFCHGAFGYAHQVPQGEVQATPAAHAAGLHQPDPGKTADGAHPGAAYFATLLLLAFGTLFVLGGWRQAATKLPVPTASRSVYRARVLPPPRGPTLPSLQVFRL